jgi:hypothetical protein
MKPWHYVVAILVVLIITGIALAIRALAKRR